MPNANLRNMFANPAMIAGMETVADCLSDYLVSDDPSEARPPEEVELIQRCRASFWEFVKVFWETIPGCPRMVENWHMEYLCGVLQKAAEDVIAGIPREHDIVINVPPGTSKSSICSILFPVWCWTRMPTMRFLTASHTDALVLDLSNKSRQVLKSEMFQHLFPEIRIRHDNDAKGAYSNTAGGDRRTCTVAGKTPMGFHSHILLCDDPIDPKKVLSVAELKTAREFITSVIPTRKVNKEVSVTILIMQRLGMGDPSDVMLDEAKKEGAAPVHHVCLPAELDKGSDGAFLEGNVSPPELAKRYINGLLDPHRLSTKVIKEMKARGAFFFSTQFQQRPFTTSGGMFKETWFSPEFWKDTAPYKGIRVRFWDNAATEGAGCNTVGTLMCMSEEGEIFVEDVVAGQWAPDARDREIVAAAHRDRERYAPLYDPVIIIEQEGGSSGKDATLYLTRKLMGFKVIFERPTGNKELRAQPFASQCGAGNVFLVHGNWNIREWIAEHVAFPTGELMDRVDSSSGAFKYLLQRRRDGSIGMRIYRGKEEKPAFIPRVVVCGKKELETLNVENKSLLIYIKDPTHHESNGHATNGHLDHPLAKLLDRHTMEFADVIPEEHQTTWDKPIPAYGVAVEQVMLTREVGKRFWTFIQKKRPNPTEIFVICDSGGNDRRALSVGMALCDLLHLKREKSLYIHGSEEGCKKHLGTPPNKFIYEQLKNSRHLVL